MLEIRGTPKEIADLILALQGQPNVDLVIEKLNEEFKHSELTPEKVAELVKKYA